MVWGSPRGSPQGRPGPEVLRAGQETPASSFRCAIVDRTSAVTQFISFDSFFNNDTTGP